MPKFVIAPHMRLQEWVAEEKGYFAAEGLDYEFRDELTSKDGKRHDFGDKVGAYQTIEQGRTSNISCACHWTINVAASNGLGKLYADAYSVSPAGVFVPPESPIREPKDLAGVPISVGYQSGSHYATIQALEQYLQPGEHQALLRRWPAVQAHGAADRSQGARGVALQRPVLLSSSSWASAKSSTRTFMIASMITGDPDAEDVRKYFRALRRAQRDIDLRPDLYTHYYKKEMPERFRDQMDTRRWGPGERLVFEPYTKEVYEESFEWIAQHHIFPEGQMGAGKYEQAVVTMESCG